MPTQETDASIEVVPYNPAWPRQFLVEQSTLQAALAPWLAGSVEHVGSTAVPGLPAKPIIDVMAPVQSLDGSRAAIKAAESVGYVYYPYKSSVMHWFCKPSPRHRTHHLHIVPLASSLWHERLTFRDALRTDPVLALEYAALKYHLASVHASDREAYTEAKAPFILATLEAAYAKQISAA